MRPMRVRAVRVRVVRVVRVRAVCVRAVGVRPVGVRPVGVRPVGVGGPVDVGVVGVRGWRVSAAGVIDVSDGVCGCCDEE